MYLRAIPRERIKFIRADAFSDAHTPRESAAHSWVGPPKLKSRDALPGRGASLLGPDVDLLPIAHDLQDFLALIILLILSISLFPASPGWGIGVGTM